MIEPKAENDQLLRKSKHNKDYIYDNGSSNSPRYKTYLGEFILVSAAFLWGTAFVFQKNASEIISPGLFNSVRYFVGFFSIICIILFLGFIRNKKNQISENRKTILTTNKKKELLIFGFIAGIWLGLGSLLQQISLSYVSITKAGFITGLYIVFVPIIQSIWKRQLHSWQLLVAILIAFIGLCIVNFIGIDSQNNFFIKEIRDINEYDIVLLISSIIWAMHVITIDYATDKGIPAWHLSSVQALVCALISGLFALFFEDITSQISSLLTTPMIIAILYTGVISTAFGFSLQAIGQKSVPSTTAALILSLESFFTAVMGWLILAEVINLPEGIGFFLMLLAAMMASIIPNKAL